MLPREFRYSFSKGVPEKSISSPLFSVRFQENNSRLHLAVVVSKRVSTLATERNAIKRKVHKIIEEHVDLDTTPYDVVFFLRRPVLRSNDSQLRQEIKNIFEKVTQ